jgi:hypothetical protein
VLTSVSDKYGNVISQSFNGVNQVTNTFSDTEENTLNPSAKLLSQVDNYADLTYTMEYDEVSGELSHIEIEHNDETVAAITYTKDSLDRLQNVEYDLDGDEVNYTYIYDNVPDGRVSSLAIGDILTSSTNYDHLGRRDTVNNVISETVEYSTTY